MDARLLDGTWPGYQGNPADNQAVYDFVTRFILQQGCTSTNGDICTYRHNGLRCAAGCLIPDADYQERFEGEAILNSSGVDLSRTGRYFADRGFNTRLLYDLQASHDSAYRLAAAFKRDFLSRARGVAETYGLVPITEEATKELTQE